MNERAGSQEPDPGEVALALQISAASIRNARQYLEDAQVLFDRGSVGHAAGLAILGQEEVGKALYFIALGHGGFPSLPKVRERFFRRHEIKQALFLVAQVVASVLDSPGIVALLDDLPPGEVSGVTDCPPHLSDLVERATEELEQYLANDPSLPRRIEKLMNGVRQGEKHRALYVDEKSGRVDEPSGFEADRALELIRDLRVVTGALGQEEPDAEQVAMLRPLLEPLFESIREQSGRGTGSKSQGDG